MKQRGFTLIELMVVIAILGIIAAVTALNVGNFFNRANDPTLTRNQTTFAELSAKPLNTLNQTELNFLVGYCSSANSSNPSYETWLIRTTLYQNQIIINLLAGDGELG